VQLLFRYVHESESTFFFSLFLFVTGFSVDSFRHCSAKVLSDFTFTRSVTLECDIFATDAEVPKASQVITSGTGYGLSCIGAAGHTNRY